MIAWVQSKPQTRDGLKRATARSPPPAAARWVYDRSPCPLPPFFKLFEPGLRPGCPLHPSRDRLQRLPALVPKFRHLDLKRPSRALGLRPIDPLPFKLLSGLRQGVQGRLAIGLDPRQLRFEPSDLLVPLRPELLMLDPLPLERPPLGLMDAIGCLPGLGP